MRKQEQPQESTGQSLSMARRSLGRVKEMDLSPEQKEKVMNMIKQAKKLESEKELHKALLIYNQVLDMMRKIKAEVIGFKFPEVKAKELWDWTIDKRLIVDLAEVEGKYGNNKFQNIPIFTKNGENFFMQVNTGENWQLMLNAKDVIMTTKGEEEFESIVISPDGSHVAVVDNNEQADPATKGCKTVNVDGKEWEHLIHQNDFDYYQEFSPDSKNFMVMGNFMSKDNVWNMLIENDQEIEAKEDMLNYAGFAFSQDSGKKAIIFQSDTAGEIDEVVMDGDKKWTTLFQDCKHPVYSPDGSRLAIVEAGAEIKEVYINDEKLESMQKITGILGKPIFSPDNQKIAFVAKIEIVPLLEFLIINDKIGVASAEFKNIFSSSLTFSPDSKNIAFAALDKDNKMVVAINETFVVKNDEYESIDQLTFSPDGTKIMFVGRKDNVYYRVVKDVSEHVK